MPNTEDALDWVRKQCGADRPIPPPLLEMARRAEAAQRGLEVNHAMFGAFLVQRGIVSDGVRGDER